MCFKFKYYFFGLNILIPENSTNNKISAYPIFVVYVWFTAELVICFEQVIRLILNKLYLNIGERVDGRMDGRMDGRTDGR